MDTVYRCYFYSSLKDRPLGHLIDTLTQMMRNTATLLCQLALLLGSAVAIYDADHWQFSTKLTEESFDGFIKDNVNAGKTVFVRWIASAG